MNHTMLTYVTLDFETFYSREVSLRKLTTLQYVLHPEFKLHGVGIKINDQPSKYFYEYNGKLIAPGGFDFAPCTTMSELLNSYPWHQMALICHNSAFDAKILDLIYDIHPAYHIDTLSMARALWPHSKHTLKNVAELLKIGVKGTQLENFEGIVELTHEQQLHPEHGMAVYCRNDVDLTWAAFNKMMQKFPDDELDVIDATIKMWVEPVLELDTARVNQFIQDFKAKREAAVLRSGHTQAQLSSAKQFLTILEQRTGTLPTNQEGKNSLSKSDPGWAEFKKQFPNLSDLYAARELCASNSEISKSTHLLSAVADQPNAPVLTYDIKRKLAVPLKYYGATTGRWSGDQKINLQNIQRGSELRRSIHAPDGYILIASDLSQIEPRMLAWLSDNKKLLNAFKSNQDVYCETASELYGYPVTKENTMERFVGKCCVISLGYGQGPNKFQQNLAIGAMGKPVEFTNAEAAKIVYGFREIYPAIPEFWKHMDHVLVAMLDPACKYEFKELHVRHNRIFMPNGLYLEYPGLTMDDEGQMTYFNGKFWKKIYGAHLAENLCQALSRIVIAEQLRTIAKRYKPVLTVHDELVFLAPEGEAVTAEAYILSVMSTAPDWCPELPVTAEASTGKCYEK